MKTWFLAIICAALFVQSIRAGHILDETEGDIDNYIGNILELQRDHQAQKRSCIRRAGNCDHRPKDCCYNSSCRCNLWGANCRCQRMGLFQKWG